MDCLSSICKSVREMWKNRPCNDNEEEKARIYFEFEKKMNEKMRDNDIALILVESHLGNSMTFLKL